MSLPASSTLADLLAPLAAELEGLETWLAETVADGPEHLAPLLAHAARFRGKRLRAAQVMLVAEACGGIRPEHRIVAGIIELIHAASLMHDDLLDEASERRALDCMHVEWGSHAAVLLGDWIYSRAFEVSTTIDDPTCSRVLARASMAVCAGEIHQNLSRGRFDLDEAAYLSQIDGKTAALFEAGGRLAAHYAGADAGTVEAAASHGLLAGRAFQMVDDILDLAGDEERVGKSLGTDWGRGKMTLPLIRLRDALEPEARTRMQELFATGADRATLFAAPFEAATDAALTRCQEEVEQVLEDAVGALAALPTREHAETLAALTRYVGTRRR
jgi:octaprenyl-diphosphate synthase